MTVTVHVALADDHRLLREALRVTLERESDLIVIGEASDGNAALKLVATTSPDVLVLDVAMPNSNGIEAVSRIHSRYRRVKILALSAHSDQRYVVAMLKGGAAGYVTKSAAGHELVQAIRTIASGGCYLSSELTGVVVDGFRSSGFGHLQIPQPLGRREREVLQLLAEGLRSPAIAARLFISPATVESHRRNIMRKLDLHTVAELTKFAIREGLTAP